jgi:hypothetical protein
LIFQQQNSLLYEKHETYLLQNPSERKPEQNRKIDHQSENEDIPLPLPQRLEALEPERKIDPDHHLPPVSVAIPLPLLQSLGKLYRKLKIDRDHHLATENGDTHPLLRQYRENLHPKLRIDRDHHLSFVKHDIHPQQNLNAMALLERDSTIRFENNVSHRLQGAMTLLERSLTIERLGENRGTHLHRQNQQTCFPSNRNHSKRESRRRDRSLREHHPYLANHEIHPLLLWTGVLSRPHRLVSQSLEIGPLRLKHHLSANQPLEYRRLELLHPEHRLLLKESGVPHQKPSQHHSSLWTNRRILEHLQRLRMIGAVGGEKLKIKDQGSSKYPPSLRPTMSRVLGIWILS